ncbi:hypothetical protein AAFC00_004187 [Neodothiora populina]|uniref:Uncharacterized protein n=1 Tax=Neodothiora populina TaxID=2781224 RepID=A0ABR3PIU1_9PEZI
MATISHGCVGKNAVNQSAVSEDDASLSLIYSFLPPVVRRSMPKVKSLRRSFNTYRSFGGYSTGSSIDYVDSGSATPPPAYHETLAPLTSALCDDEDASTEESTPCSSKRSSFIENEQTGIQWKYASQGLNLLSLSAQ